MLKSLHLLPEEPVLSVSVSNEKLPQMTPAAQIQVRLSPLHKHTCEKLQLDSLPPPRLYIQPSTPST